MDADSSNTSDTIEFAGGVTGAITLTNGVSSATHAPTATKKATPTPTRTPVIKFTKLAVAPRTLTFKKVTQVERQSFTISASGPTSVTGSVGAPLPAGAFTIVTGGGAFTLNPGEHEDVGVELIRERKAPSMPPSQ